MVIFSTTCPKTIHRISGGSTKANSLAYTEKSTAQKPTNFITLSFGIAAGWLLLDACSQIWSSYYRKPR
jgi:retron-type reverse transcriptase